MKRALPVVLVLALLGGGAWWIFGRKPAAEPVAQPPPAAPARVADKKPEPPTGESGMPPELQLAYDDDPRGTLRLEGIVEDEAGKPVGGAVVSISSLPERSVKTEADGSFAFTELLPKSYSVVAHAGNRQGGPVEVRVTDKPEPLRLVISAGIRLEVTVEDAGTKGKIAGATVESRGLGTVSATSDQAGVARLEGLSEGWVALKVSAPGYAPAFKTFPLEAKAGGSASDTIRLEKGVAVKGVVVDGAGKPLAGVRVLAVSASSLFARQDPRKDAAESDRKGQFAFPALPAGSWRFVATDEAHAPAQSTTVTLALGVNAPEVKITMGDGGKLVGVVQDKAGKPVPLAEVRVAVSQGQDWNQGFGGGGARQATCDEQGRFSLGGLARAKVDVLAAHETGSSEVTQVDLVQVAEKRDLVLILSNAGAISGKVVDETGKPVAEARVTAWPAFEGGEGRNRWALLGATSDVADQAGQFTIAGLPEGTYQLRATRAEAGKSGENEVALWQRSPVAAKTGDTTVTLTLPADAIIEGKVAYADGTAPDAFSVGTSQWGQLQPFSSKDGSFRLVGVVPGTRYLTVSGPGFARKTTDPLEVKPGGKTDVGTITVDRGRTITGRVIDVSGSAVEGAKVSAGSHLMGDGKGLSSGGMFGNVKSATSGPSGGFAVSGVGPGAIMIVAEGEPGRSPVVEVPPGQQDVDLTLTLSQTTVLEGKVMSDGKPVAGAMVVAQPSAAFRGRFMVKAGEDGAFRFDRLVPDTYSLSALRQTGGMGGVEMATRQVVVTPGSNQSVVIELPHTGNSVLVTVRNAAGQAPPAAQVFFGSGRLSARTALELERLLAIRGAGSWAQGFVKGEEAWTVANLVPGPATACALPVWGDINDPRTMEALTKDTDALPVTCQFFEVGSGKQNVVVTVPPKP